MPFNLPRVYSLLVERISGQTINNPPNWGLLLRLISSSVQSKIICFWFMENGAKFFFGLPEPNEIMENAFANSPGFPFSLDDIRAIVICSDLSGLGIPFNADIDIEGIRTMIGNCSVLKEFAYFEDESCLIIHKKRL